MKVQKELEAKNKNENKNVKVWRGRRGKKKGVIAALR